MSVKCSNKKCGHTNPDGYSYCVKCGQLLGGKQEKIVVIKSDYDKMDAKLKDITKKGLAPAGYELVSKAAMEEERKNALTQISKLKKELDDIKKNGFAPEGYYLEKKLSVEVQLSKLNRFLYEKTLPRSEYNDLVRRANQSWYEKLWDTIKRWWDEAAFVIVFFTVACLGGLAVGFAIEGIVNSCSNKPDDISVKIVKRDGLWGVVKGEDVVLPFEYDSIVADKYDTIYSRIYKDERTGLVNNTTGKVIIPCIYNAIGHLDKLSFRGKLIAVQKEDKKWHFVDYSGKPTGTLYYDYAEWTANSDYGTVGLYIDGSIKYGFANSDGFIQIKCQYVTVYNFNEGLAVVRSKPNGPLECIDTRGKRIYTLKQNIASVYCDSLMPVSNSYKWDANSTLGFLDRKGNLAIGMYFTPYTFSNGSTHIPFFNNGKAYVRYNGKNGWIDKTGRFTPVD